MAAKQHGSSCDIPDPPALVGRDHHVLVVAGGIRHLAQCSCGWTSKRRLLLDAAKVDALTHSAEIGHPPASPLVFRKSRDLR